MTPPRIDELHSEPGSGSSEWRRRRLLRAGLSAKLADTVAADRRYDVHALLQLIDRGCRPDLAVRILAPLDWPSE